MKKTNTREKKIRYYDDMIQTLIIATNENLLIHANLTMKEHQPLSGLDADINPDRPPKNFVNAMERQAAMALWAEAFNQDFVGFQDQQVFKIVRPKPGEKVLGTLTRMEYKEDNGKIVKCKVRFVVRGAGAASQESLLSKTSSTQVAHTYLLMDGKPRIFCCGQ
jgi:hypothetical protein